MEYLQLSKVYVNNIHNKAGTQAMSISSGGIVTQPTKPAFHASTNGAGSASYFTPGVAVFPHADVNIGNCYSTSTGKFTAPIAGTYYFSGMMLSNLNTRLYFQLRKNNSVINGTQIETVNVSGTYQSASSDCVITLAVNDLVHLHLTSNDAYGSQYANFKGFLIG